MNEESQKKPQFLLKPNSEFIQLTDNIKGILSSKIFLIIDYHGNPKFPRGYVKGAIMASYYCGGIYRPLYRLALKAERATK